MGPVVPGLAEAQQGSECKQIRSVNVRAGDIEARQAGAAVLEEAPRQLLQSARRVVVP